MKQLFRKGLLCAAMASLCALSWTVQAQNTEPVAPPAPPAAAAPPVEVEAPDAPAAAETPNVEAPDTDTQRSDDRRDRRRGWRHRNDNGNERVAVGSNATLEKGGHADTVVSVFGSSTSDGDVSEAVVSVVGDTRVTGTAQDVVAVLGSVYLNGKAAGDVVAVLGDVELGPQAEVDGEVVVVGGVLKRDAAAIIHGQVQNVIGMSLGSFKWLRPWAQHCLVYMRPLAIADGLGWAWGLSFGFLALYVLIAVLFRDSVDRCVRTFEAQPGKSIVAAILATLLTPVVFALLFITVIGIAFVPLAALGLFLVGLFGKAVMLAWIGRRILKTRDEGEAFHTGIAVLLGGIIVLVLYVVPVIGFVVYNTLGILGVGIAVYALIQAVKQKRAESGPTLATAGASFPGANTTFTDTSRSQGYSSTAPNPDFVSSSAGTTQAFTPERPDESSASAGTTEDLSNPSSSSTSSMSAPPPTPPQILINTASTYPRAGFGVRMGALFIDVILVAVLLGIVDSTKEAELVALATYGAVMWKLKSTTIGGIVFGLQVVRLDGRPIDWATATVRALSCFLSLCVAGLGFIWIAFDEGRQAWHDKIAGTAVVRVPKGVSLL
jgi:uncharacterized RDD family membrane protein YckC